MRHVLLPSVLAAILSLLLVTPPARACLNDRETKTKETEFQVQYGRSLADQTPTPSVEEAPTYLDYLLMGTGGFLGMTGLGIGIGVGFNLARKPS